MGAIPDGASGLPTPSSSPPHPAAVSSSKSAIPVAILMIFLQGRRRESVESYWTSGRPEDHPPVGLLAVAVRLIGAHRSGGARYHVVEDVSFFARRLDVHPLPDVRAVVVDGSVTPALHAAANPSRHAAAASSPLSAQRRSPPL